MNDSRTVENLVAANIWLARWCTSKFADNSDPEEIDGVALFGLFIAARNFDPGRKVKFSTYAVVCIRNELRKHRERIHRGPTCVGLPRVHFGSLN